MSKDIDNLAKAMLRASYRSPQAQLRFATCTSVDWENKTMEAKGVSDELPYYDVMLGLGFAFLKPKSGSMCLIGVLERQDAYTFLIAAEEVEEVELKSDMVVINEGENAGLVKVEALTKQLNGIEKELNTLKKVFAKWVPVANDGGAALKGSITSWAGKELGETKQSDIENDKIKH